MFLGNRKWPRLKLYYSFLSAFIHTSNEPLVTMCYSDLPWLRGIHPSSVEKSLTHSFSLLIASLVNGDEIWICKGTSCLFFHAWTINSRNNPFLSFIFKQFVPIQLLGFQTQSSLETQGRSSMYRTSEFTVLLYNTRHI